MRIPPRTSFLVATALVLAAAGWAWFEAGRIRVNSVIVHVDSLPAGLESLRIAQITDLHVGSARSRTWLNRTVELLGQLQPDLVVSTGDMIDGKLDWIDPLAREFLQIQPPLGKYAVLGNHDFYSGVKGSLRFHEAGGFIMLRQEVATPIKELRLVGVDGPADGRRGWRERTDEMPLLSEESREDLVILLKHYPKVEPEALGLFDLQLSGHTHGGQVFPFGLLQAGYRPGLHELEGGSWLFLSPGTGTWGAPLRLACPPEITLIEFRPRRGSQQA